jgi:hypothetical protein
MQGHSILQLQVSMYSPEICQLAIVNLLQVGVASTAGA